jgi:hypothetical protein
MVFLELVCGAGFLVGCVAPELPFIGSVRVRYGFLGGGRLDSSNFARLGAGRDERGFKKFFSFAS